MTPEERAARKQSVRERYEAARDVGRERAAVKQAELLAKVERHRQQRRDAPRVGFRQGGWMLAKACLGLAILIPALVLAAAFFFMAAQGLWCMAFGGCA